MGVNSTAGAAIEASTNPQLEGRSDREPSGQKEDSLTPTPYPPHPAPSTIDVTTPDPWTDESQTESSSDSDDDSPKMSLREMLSEKLGARNLKGFVKQMPQVSTAEVRAEERANRNSKVDISCMTIAEINESLRDPILRKELMPQLWYSDYVFITDELGEIIKVERSS